MKRVADKRGDCANCAARATEPTGEAPGRQASHKMSNASKGIAGLSMTQVKQTFIELAVITVVGTAIGLAANGLNNRGVILGKDYFPRGQARPPTTQTATKPAAAETASSDTRANGELQAAIQSIIDNGLQPITHKDVVALFKDPLYQAGVYIFVDARDDQNYILGHIPGAYQLDHYQLESYIDQVLPVCQQAMKIVTYCNGGDCEDSKFAALDLINHGLDPSRIFVYPGGFTQWYKSDLPVELGSRGSNDIIPGSQVGGSHE